MKFTDYLSGIRLPDCSKLTINLKNGNDVTIFRHDVFVKFFWRCFVSLVKFSCWSKFHVNINVSIGSGVMIISFYKGLTRNPEIGNNPVWVLPNIWRLGRVRSTEFGTEALNAFTVSELLRENQKGVKLPPAATTQTRLKTVRLLQGHVIKSC